MGVREMVSLCACVSKCVCESVGVREDEGASVYL